MNADAAATDFRSIPWGDIDLRREIRMDRHSGIAQRERGRGRVRRMYSAKVGGREAEMTVAVYQGNNSEEQWVHDISKYSRIR